MKSNIRKTPIKFLLGQDSEFIMIHRGKCAPMIGKADDENGYDGTGFHKISEVRSCPSECPLEIVNFIRHAFLRKSRKYPQVLNYAWKAGSYFLHPIGSHTHFGVKKDVIDHSTANKIISNYCGSLSLAIENPKEAYDRRNTGEGEYGRASDFREQFHGGFESRVFSSFLSSPAIAAAHLCLVKTVMYELLNNSAWHPTERFVDKDFIEVRADKVQYHFEDLWKEISGMQLYHQYKEYIDIFKFLITNNLTWEQRNTDGTPTCMKVAWGICSNIPEQPKPEKPPFKLQPVNGNPIFANL